MTGGAPRVSIEVPRGAPAHGGALEGVGAAVTPPEGVQEVEVRVDGVAIGCAVRRLPDQLMVSAWCDTRGLPGGLHEITVGARWADGTRAAAALLLLVTLGQAAELTPPSN